MMYLPPCFKFDQFLTFLSLYLIIILCMTPIEADVIFLLTLRDFK